MSILAELRKVFGAVVVFRELEEIVDGQTFVMRQLYGPLILAKKILNKF